MFGEVATLSAGDRVALFLPNCPEFVACYYAAMHSGAIAVSLNVMLKRDEVKFILEDCEAKVLVTTAALLAEVPESSQLPALKKIFCIDKTDRADAFALDEFSALECGGLAAEMAPDDGAAILYTSGTTGKPKGALLSHGNIISNIRAGRHHTRMALTDRLICYLPLFNVSAKLHYERRPRQAATLIRTSVFQPDEILASLEADGVTMFSACRRVPAAARRGHVAYFFHSVRYCFTAAAPMSMTVAREWRQITGQTVCEGYGLTETSPFASYNHDSSYREGSVGVPLENVEMKVADAQGNALPAGETGEIAIKGPNVMLVYFAGPRTARRSRGWFSPATSASTMTTLFFLVDRPRT